MKLLYISNIYYPNFSYRENILPFELKNNYNVLLLTSRKNYINNELYPKEIIEGEISIKRINVHNVYKNKFIFKNLKKEIMMFNPDIIYYNGGVFSINTYLLAKYKNIYHYKLYIEDHSHFSIYNDNVTEKIFRNIFILFYLPIIKVNVNKFIAYSNETKEYINNIFNINKNIIIIPIGVNNKIFKRDSNQRKNIRSKYNLREKDILLIYAGKIDKDKNPLTLVKAFNKIKKDNVYLLLIGDKEQSYYYKLKDYIDSNNINNIFIDERVKNNELSYYYNAADIGIWPHQESLTIMEALSTGLPVIVKDTQYLKDIIGKGGLLYKENDINDLKNKVILLIENNKIRKNLIENNLNDINNNFSFERIINKYIKLFNSD